MNPYTPAPWETVGSCIRDARTSDGGGFMVADCGGLISFRREEECIANAARIVQCVNVHDDLLAALKAVMSGQIGGTPDMDAERFQMARAAIAKAEGGA